jgi:IS1 family transposase
LRGICRAVGVGLRGLIQFYADPPSRTPAVILQRLEAELDELWSFVGKKTNRQWVWIAMDATTRQVIAFHVGDRHRQGAEALWGKIPTVYQEHAVFYTDHYAAYMGVIPSAQHRAISKLARTTDRVERFNCTLRQRVSRLVPPRSRSPRSSAITLEPSSISSVITISLGVQHHQNSTTGKSTGRCANTSCSTMTTSWPSKSV